MVIVKLLCLLALIINYSIACSYNHKNNKLDALWYLGITILFAIAFKS